MNTSTERDVEETTIGKENAKLEETTEQVEEKPTTMKVEELSAASPKQDVEEVNTTEQVEEKPTTLKVDVEKMSPKEDVETVSTGDAVGKLMATDVEATTVEEVPTTIRVVMTSAAPAKLELEEERATTMAEKAEEATTETQAKIVSEMASEKEVEETTPHATVSTTSTTEGTDAKLVEEVSNATETKEPATTTSTSTTPTTTTTTTEAASSSSTSTTEPTVSDIFEKNYQDLDEDNDISENELKVIPLQKADVAKESPPPPDPATAQTSTTAAQDSTFETTTGHFLGETTFHLIRSERSNETSLIRTRNSETKDFGELVAASSSGMFTKCAVGQFECVNGTSIKDGSSCIQKSERCDSVSHCSDNSDEQDCERLGCPGHFQCRDGFCLARHHVCDGIAHCNDGSDEIECDRWQCNFDEISCNPGGGGGGSCLPALWKCDGLEQCANGFDESNCPDTCTNDEYFCVGQRKCIPEAWRCDGTADCSGGEDERLCDCPVDNFRCNAGGCVPDKYVCDGQPQCPDLSDEWGCFSVEGGELKVRIESQELKPVCGEGWSKELSDEVCAKLGFTEAKSFSISGEQGGGSVYRYVNANSSQLLLNLAQASNCSDGLVQIECEQYHCGRESITPTLEQRIAGGINSEPEQLPSLALVYSNDAAIKCTANIISPRWALASYTCIMGKTEFIDNRNVGELDWMLFAGTSRFNSSLVSGGDRNSSFQVVEVRRIVPYPQAKYKQFLYSGDVVLLELANPLRLNEAIGSACLTERAMIDEEQLCLTAGWGVDPSDVASTEQYLKYLPVPTMPTEKCNSTLHYNGSLTDDAICAGYLSSSKTTCYNDEGAPLMCHIESSGQWRLEGTLSYHGNCGKRPHPAIYNSITSSISTWIRNTVGNDRMFASGAKSNGGTAESDSTQPAGDGERR